MTSYRGHECFQIDGTFSLRSLMSPKWRDCLRDGAF